MASATRPRSAPSRLVVLAVTTVALLGLLVPSAVAQAGSVARWSEMSGTCWATSIDLEGQLQVDLAAGTTVAHTYTVSDATTTHAVGDDQLTTVVDSSEVLPFTDNVWFGADWGESFPYTYVADTSVVVAGSEVYGQTLEAVCTAEGEPAVITLTERFPEGPPTPVPPVPHPIVPTFTG